MRGRKRHRKKCAKQFLRRWLAIEMPTMTQEWFIRRAMWGDDCERVEDDAR